MAKTITISVPEDLQERLAKVKDRLNISKICQEALDRQVSLIEHMQEASTMQGIERLRAQKQAMGTRLIDEWEMIGHIEGTAAAIQLHYEELNALDNAFPEADSPDWAAAVEPLDQQTLDNLRQDLDASPSQAWPEHTQQNLRTRGVSPSDLQAAQTGYLRGWIAGILETYREEIKPRL